MALAIGAKDRASGAKLPATAKAPAQGAFHQDPERVERQSAVADRILKGLIKLANKKGEKVPREVEMSTSPEGRPWKRQHRKPLLRHGAEFTKDLGLGPAGPAEVLSEVESSKGPWTKDHGPSAGPGIGCGPSKAWCGDS